MSGNGSPKAFWEMNALNGHIRNAGCEYAD